MELAKLRYFYAVAKHGHVTRAAEEIHIAQPALTKAIKQLEEELGVPLFYKKGRNIYLTAYGEYLQGKLEGVFAQLDGISTDLEALKKEQRNTVKINVLAASTAVTEAVIAYKKKHPEVIFQVIQNETETDCDISTAIVEKGFAKSLKSTVLEEKIFLAVPKNSQYAQKQGIALREVKDEGFVHLAGSRQFRTVCDGFCTASGFKPQTAFESDSIMAVKNIIGANAGVGFWPEYSWGKVSAEVALLPILEPDCKRKIKISLHESPLPSPLAEGFYGYLVKFLQKRQASVKKVYEKAKNFSKKS